MLDKKVVLNTLSEDLIKARNLNDIKEIITIMCILNNEHDLKRYLSTTLER